MIPRHPKRVIELRNIEACLCVPDIGFTCQRCDRGESAAIVEDCTDISDDRSSLDRLKHGGDSLKVGIGELWPDT